MFHLQPIIASSSSLEAGSRPGSTALQQDRTHFVYTRRSNGDSSTPCLAEGSSFSWVDISPVNEYIWF